MNIPDTKVGSGGFVKYVAHLGNDEFIVRAARVSTGRGFVSWEPYVRCVCGEVAAGNSLDSINAPGAAPCADVATRGPYYQHASVKEKFPRGDFGLLETLYSMGHSTPFEFAVLTFEIQAPLMVFREWHRHRTFAYSEFSARYAQMPNLHYVPALERIQKQSKTMKQGSGEVFPVEEAAHVAFDIGVDQEAVYASYETMIRAGVANEIARVNTPVSRYSKMRATGNLRNWLHFLELRMAPNAQYEIRCYANEIAKVIKAQFPKTYQLFEEHTLHGIRLSKTEAALLYSQLLPLEGAAAPDDVVKARTKLLGKLAAVLKTPDAVT